MGISINLEFGDGTFERGFDNPQLVVTITTPDSSITQVSVQLSPSPLPSLYQAWKKQYDSLRPEGRQSRFKKNQATNISVQNCAKDAKTIRRELNKWLQPLNLILEPILQPYSNEEIYPVIYTGKVTSLATKNILHRLPWQEWNLNSKMFEPTLCFNSYQADTVKPNTVVADDADSYRRVTIIAIFGNSTNINIKADEDLLKKLEKQGADLHCLYQPNRADFNLLWEKHPDILYFAGVTATLKTMVME
jgi:hypothetical protein